MNRRHMTSRQRRREPGVVSGGDNHGGTALRLARMPEYLASISAYVRLANGIPALDKKILFRLADGMTIRDIAVDLGMKTPTVYKRIAKHRAMGGISGPGTGR